MLSKCLLQKRYWRASMAPALSDLQPQSAPKATAAAQTAIGDGLVAEAQAFADELAAWRHDLHQMPELGNSLPQTSAYIQARLTEMDIPFATLVDGSCVVGLGRRRWPPRPRVMASARMSRPVRSSCSVATWTPARCRGIRRALCIHQRLHARLRSRYARDGAAWCGSYAQSARGRAC